MPLRGFPGIELIDTPFRACFYRPAATHRKFTKWLQWDGSGNPLGFLYWRWWRNEPFPL